MAPAKATREVRARQPLKLTNAKNVDQNIGIIKKAGKRKAEMSPGRNDKIKRSALGNVTNAVFNLQKENQPTAGKAATVGGVNVGVGGLVNRKRDILTAVPIGKQEQNQQQQQQVLGILSDVSNLKNSKSQTVLGAAVNVINNVKNKVLQGPTINKPFAVQLKQQQQQQQQNNEPIINNLDLQHQAPIKHQQIIGQTKIMTRAAAARASLPISNVNATINVKQQKDVQEIGSTVVDLPQKPTRRISNEFHKSKSEEDSLYMSALENCSSSESIRLSDSVKTRRSLALSNNNTNTSSVGNHSSILLCSTIIGKHSTKSALSELEQIDYISGENIKVPNNVVDFDKENWDDPFQVSNYAMDIFNYLKSREEKFICSTYLDFQKNLTRWMRSLLVDWMVEVQETFELNHETLYLAVKIVDLYLCKVLMAKDDLQLLGAAALFMSCKYDERTPPLIDDFLYICDGAYSQKQIIAMEKDVFKMIGFDLGIPLSYRFLRRYARISTTPMSILTLARYILEFSLMDYDLITISESKMASAALFIALKMSRSSNWTSSLEYYSGYKLADFSSVVIKLNNGLHLKQKDTIKTVRNKYSHKIFFEVAKTPLLTNDELFEIETVSLNK